MVLLAGFFTFGVLFGMFLSVVGFTALMIVALAAHALFASGPAFTSNIFLDILVGAFVMQAGYACSIAIRVLMQRARRRVLQKKTEPVDADAVVTRDGNGR